MSSSFATSDATFRETFPDFSRKTRTTALDCFQNGKLSPKERLEAVQYLDEYAATLASILKEWNLQPEYRDEMTQIERSIASVVKNAKASLPELKGLERPLPSSIKSDRQKRMFSAFIRDLGEGHEGSEESQERTVVPSSVHGESNPTLYMATFPDFTQETRTRALTCLQNGNASPKKRLEAATYLAVYEAALFTVLQDETPIPAWPVLCEMHSGIVSALVDAKKSVPGLEAVLNRLASRRWGDAKADGERVYLLKALTDGDLFEDGGATLQLKLTKGNFRSQTIAVALQVETYHSRLYSRV